jgi:intracellular septation protein A
VAMFNKIALGFVVFFSVCMIINTYLGETERVQSNAVYFLLNGFAYVVSALEMEKEKTQFQR